ncbi:MAG TPA: tetrahydromethanopterin:alpha-L-glutamate ligase, partial [Methanosarcina sp.]|nr:tetrahydromethanopterin:alpha-L-glutamate ligase [Methanosarcina sp.]
MKKIGIVITDPEDWTARELLNAAEKRGFTPFALDLRAAEVKLNSSTFESKTKSRIKSGTLFKVGDVDLCDLDAVIVRDVGAGAFEGVSLRFDILRELEEKGIPIVNSPEAIRNAANKYHASYLLAKAGIPVPETIAVQNIETALKVISRFEDAIIKPVFGYKGKNIMRIKKGEILFSDRRAQNLTLEIEIQSLLEERGMLYIQEFVENPGRDIRAFVVNGTAIGAIYRKAASGSWVNNLSQGGRADRCVLNEAQKEIAEKASLAVGTVFAGVDIIESSGSLNKKIDIKVAQEKNSPIILEVNGTPSGKGIFDAWGINPAEYILEYVEN